jgi:glycosyltransferase involved in cell wall biosynthesis
LWNNETSLGEQKIRDEVKEYDNIQISFENKSDFIKRENPLITLVITLYNQEDKIKYIYASIQKQELKEIEIIFVDDASKDNSEKTVKYLMENDQRIVYLKNSVNRRAFFSRYKGILKAKGKYVLVIDPDDLLYS